jgi:RND family efflux transporter MFP subunit
LNDSSISAEIQGRAIDIKAEVGDTIKRGQLLVSLDCRSYINSKKQATAALNLSKSQLNFAQKQYNRNQRLLKRGVLPRETFDRSESDLLTSRADISIKEVAIESADLAISKCKIYAPFSGQVTNKFVQQGQLVNPGSALIQLLQTDKLEIEADLSPDELIKARDSRRLKFIASTQEFTVKIRTVLRQLNKTSNTQRVRLTGESIDSETSIAGLNGRLVWKDGTSKLPPEYMVRRKDELGVMVAEDNKARFQALKGAREGQPAMVNLRSSSQIIIVNRYSVKDGQAVVTE